MTLEAIQQPYQWVFMKSSSNAFWFYFIFRFYFQSSEGSSESNRNHHKRLIMFNLTGLELNEPPETTCKACHVLNQWVFAWIDWTVLDFREILIQQNHNFSNLMHLIENPSHGHFWTYLESPKPGGICLERPELREQCRRTLLAARIKSYTVSKPKALEQIRQISQCWTPYLEGVQDAIGGVVQIDFLRICEISEIIAQR